MSFWGENQGTVNRKAKKERKEVGKAKMVFYDLTNYFLYRTTDIKIFLRTNLGYNVWGSL